MTELRLQVGDQRVSQGRTITEADIVIWAGLVHDFTSLHVDVELMRDSFFGRPIAQGYIALNLSIGLMFPGQADWYAPAGVDATFGWQDVRFHEPVYVGDTLRCRRKVLRLNDGEVAHRVEVVNQSERIVMSGIERMSPSAGPKG
jgi:acyl dehydratase